MIAKTNFVKSDTNSMEFIDFIPSLDLNQTFTPVRAYVDTLVNGPEQVTGPEPFVEVLVRESFDGFPIKKFIQRVTDTCVNGDIQVFMRAYNYGKGFSEWKMS